MNRVAGLLIGTKVIVYGPGIADTTAAFEGGANVLSVASPSPLGEKVPFTIMTILLALLGLYLLAALGMFLLQGRFVFFPNSIDAGNPGQVGLEFDDVWFDDGNRHGWWIPHPSPRATLLFCHGNRGNITHRVASIEQFHRAGLAVFIFDYAGYGKSKGRVSERAMYRDALNAWQWLNVTQGIPENEIILFGRSLGTGVAVELATQVRSRALILESPYTSIADIAVRKHPWLPIRLLTRIHFDSMSKIASIREPKLIIHSLDDAVIPFGLGKRLYRRASEPKRFLRIRGSHATGHLETEPLYSDTLRSFLDEVDHPARRRYERR